ncbi:hypothetical protein T492DRAFT_207440 [Pavlovales sp. CCMP2436]|nr:hypothetical protein T492DRAFT_207440 [Pavlovales sp. CCMP2436]
MTSWCACARRITCTPRRRSAQARASTSRCRSAAAGRWTQRSGCSSSAIPRLRVRRCSMRSAPAVGCGRPMCEWVVQELHQIDARTVQKTRTTAQAAGKGFARKLQPGDWVVAQARESGCGRGAGDRYWIGEGADAGDGSCIIKEFTHGGGKLEQTTFTKGDTALAVKWFDRHAANPEGINFVEWDSVAAGNDPDARFVLNATEVRAVSVKLDVVPPVGRPLVVSRASRSGVQPPAPEAPTIWELPRKAHGEILATMW